MAETDPSSLKLRRTGNSWINGKREDVIDRVDLIYLTSADYLLIRCISDVPVSNSKLKCSMVVLSRIQYFL
jgi:hypothetical protein